MWGVSRRTDAESGHTEELKIRRRDDMGRLDGKVAAITGSARGIGKQIALTFAKEGADIVLNDLSAEEMEATAKEIRDLGRRVVTVLADISTKEGATRLIETAIGQFKRVDMLVNNAAIHRRGSLLEVSEEDWDLVLRVDLKSVFLCTQAVAKHMMAQKYGKIINISSGSGLGYDGAEVHYASAKAGIVQLTKTCARELGSYGINVNCIAPGKILTTAAYYGRTPEEVEQKIAKRIEQSVLHRVGTTQDIANLALFLASDESSFISAQTISCDGGRMDRM